MPPIPLLFLGDSPGLQSGLGRIGRDLACLCCQLPEFRVGYLGRGGVATRQFPFIQYVFPESAGWGQDYLNYAWTDFAGDQPGILFAIWDATRLHWVPRNRGFKKWIYCPVDATGPNDRLTGFAAESLAGFDRVLSYTKWGAGVLERTLGKPVDWIPHGINLDVFQPRDRKAARIALGFSDKDTVIGCVMTNQQRKDWGLAAGIAAGLASDLPRVKFWWHVDVLERHWSLPALIRDYGLEDRVRITLTGSLNDTEMSYYYSGCDLTILPSLGEGFGFPIVESLACGVPCMVGDYAGGAELVAPWMRVRTQGWRLDGLYNCLRPTYDLGQWLVCIKEALNQSPQAVEAVQSVLHLDWKNLWPSVWRKWFLEGLA